MSFYCYDDKVEFGNVGRPKMSVNGGKNHGEGDENWGFFRLFILGEVDL